jgi:hypothetical protein
VAEVVGSPGSRKFPLQRSPAIKENFAIQAVVVRQPRGPQDCQQHPGRSGVRRFVRKDQPAFFDIHAFQQMEWPGRCN